MAREQKKLVEKLDSFTNALGDIVKILKEEVKNKKNDASEKISMGLSDNITKIAAELEEVKKDVKGIKKDTEAIKSAVESLKTQKEKGMIGEVGDRKNMKSMKQGISIMLLLAAGVLAIGLAFKIVGKVDFLSVIALSIGIIAIAKTAEILGNLKGLTYKKAVMGAATLVIMAGALAISSMVLKYIQPMTASQMLTTVLLAGALGLATYFLFKAMNKIEIKPTSSMLIPLLPLILPLISLGIMLSSKILSQTQPIPLITLLGIILLSISVAAMMFAIKPVLSMKLSGKDISKILLLPLVVPIMAMAIVLASLIFQLYKPIGLKLALNILFEGIAMGLAIAAFSLSVFILGKLDIDALAIGELGVIMVATALVGASWIMALFNPSAKAPPIKWSFSTGLSLLIFSIPTILLGMAIMGGVGAPALALGLLGVVLISIAIVAVSHIVSLGNYENYPPLKWVLGVGLSLIGFSLAMLVLGNPITLALLAIGSGSIMLVSYAIQKASLILAKGDYNSNYPSLGWSLGVTTALKPFALFMSVFGLILSSFGLGKKILEKGIVALSIVAGGMVDVSHILKKGTWKSGEYPSPEWSGGVGTSIFLFAKTMLALKLMKETPKGFVKFIELLAQGLVAASHNLEGGNWISSAPTPEWAYAVGMGISAFTYPIVELAKSGRKMMKMIAKDPKGFKDFIVGFISAISHGLVESANILAKGKWGGAVPTREWSTAVAMAIDAFTYPIIKLAESGKKIQKMMKKGKFTDFIVDFITATAQGLVTAADIFAKGNWSGAVPSSEWVTGVSNALRALKINEEDAKLTNNFVELLKVFDRLPSLSIYSKLSRISKGFFKLSNSLLSFSDSVKGIGVLKDTANSILLFSLIDNSQLSKTLDILDKKTETLKKISNETPTIIGHLEELLDAAGNINVYQSVNSEGGSENKSMVTLINHVSSIDKNIQEMLNSQKKNTNEVNERYQKEMEKAQNVN